MEQRSHPALKLFSLFFSLWQCPCPRDVKYKQHLCNEKKRKKVGSHILLDKRRPNVNTSFFISCYQGTMMRVSIKKTLKKHLAEASRVSRPLPIDCCSRPSLFESSGFTIHPRGKASTTLFGCAQVLKGGREEKSLFENLTLFSEYLQRESF